MKLSPLQLSHYFILDLHFTAAGSFDPAKEVGLKEEHFNVEPSFTREADGLQWKVALRVRQEAPPECNVPYTFSVAIVGIFDVHPNFEKSRLEALVQTNAPSVLYSILREVVRDFTTRGPYAGLMLPSVSFSPEPQKDSGSEKPQ